MYAKPHTRYSSKFLHTRYTPNITLVVKGTEVKHRHHGARKAGNSAVDSGKSPSITILLYNPDRHAEGTTASRRRELLQSWAAHLNDKSVEAGTPGLERVRKTFLCKTG